MKKILGLLLCLIALTSYSHAQLQRETNLGDIIIKFCNDTTVQGGSKTAILDAEPQLATDICMLIVNDGPTDATISLNFVDGTITSDNDQKKACEPETSKLNFGQYVTGYSTTINLKAGATLQTGATITFPAGYAGTAYGCATFQVINDEIPSTGESQMFTILSRRASFIDINVKGDYVIDLQAQDATMIGSLTTLDSNKISVVDSLLIPRQNFTQAIDLKDPFALRLGKPLIVRSNLRNNGNIGLDASVQTNYRAWFGLINIDLGTQQQQFVPGQSKAIELETNDLARWVGGPTTITQTIAYKPIIIGSTAGLDPLLLQDQTMQLVSSGLVTAWIGWLIIAVILLILIIWISIRIRHYNQNNHHKKSKKHSKKDRD